MSNNKNIKSNVFFDIITKLTTIMVPLIVTPYTARIFKADGIGINSYTLANVSYFMLFCTLGITGYGRRTIAINRDNRDKVSHVFWELQLIHFITLIITSLAYFILVFNSKAYGKYYLAQYLMLLSSFFDIKWFYEAYERFKFIAIRNIVIKILLLISIFTFVHKKDDLMIYIFISGLAVLASNISLWFGISRTIHFVPIKELNMAQHMKDIMIFFMPTIAASVYSILDKSEINWITHSEAENGYYEQAMKILQVCNIFVQSLSAVSAPRMSFIFSEGRTTEFKQRLDDALHLMLMLAFPVAFGVSGIASNLVPIFLGEGYSTCIILLYIFMPLVIVLGISVYLDGMYLVPSGQRLKSAMAVIVGAASNLFLNIILVLKFAAIGAAIATLLTECIVSSIMIFLSRKMVDWKAFMSYFLKYLICSCIMFIEVIYINTLVHNKELAMIIQIITGALIYAALLLILKDKYVLKMLYDITGKLKKQ